MTHEEAARQKALRLSIPTVACICHKTGIVVRLSLTGEVHDPCECGGRGYWWQSAPGRQWLSPADILAMPEPT